MNEATMLARVQAHLDARCDPFDDSEVVAFLDAHPEALGTVASLRADARALATSRKAPRRRWPLVVATALLAVAAGALVAQFAWPDRPQRGAGRILAANLEEILPRAHVAATYMVRESLVETPNATLECWQLHSEPR